MSEVDRMRISAVKTLEAMGYTCQGGQLWKPPLGVASQSSGHTTLVIGAGVLEMRLRERITRLQHWSREQFYPEVDATASAALDRIEVLEAGLRAIHADLRSGKPLDGEFIRVWDENLEKLYSE